LPAPARRDGGQRSYGDDDRRRLTFIRQCREFGFPIEQVRSLVKLTEDGDRSCMEARSIAQDHLEAAREKLAELKGLERTLADFIKRCDAVCSGGPGPDCVILKDHGQTDGRHQMLDRPNEVPVIKTAIVYAAAAFFEIAGCFSFWAWSIASSTRMPT
jgi:DNA-binding transcriptional MerR regulator